MADETTRFVRWSTRALARATTPRRAGVVIASVTAATTVVAGILMTLVDSDNFPSIGTGLWWAVQTVTTVGYGDDVPTSVAGQLLATLVMLLGIGFLTVITASITSAFVANAQREHARGQTAPDATAEQFQQIQEQLDQIKAAVTSNR